MQETRLPGEPPVTIRIRRSARARRLSLRVSGLDGRVTLSLPPRARLAEALAFVAEREEWIRDALARQPARAPVRAGGRILWEGRELIVTEASVRRLAIEGERLLVPAGSRPGPRIAGFLKLAARQRLEAACLRHATRLGRGYTAISLRDPRSRWGSCTADGRLMFSWRLVMAPPEVLDYVAAHEVAHLARMDHSPAFWAEVAGLMPGFEAPRRWLRRHGALLHTFDLDTEAEGHSRLI